MIVGVGLGGTSDVAMQLAKEASTFRKIGSANPDPDVAQLERELLDKINQTGIGPQGLGGSTTALAVNIEWAHTHISQNPVAVNIQCWRGERASARISAEGKVNFAMAHHKLQTPLERGGHPQAATGRHRHRSTARFSASAMRRRSGFSMKASRRPPI